MSDNYEKMRDEMKERFLSMDVERIVSSHGLRMDGDDMLLTFLGEPVRLSVKTGTAMIKGPGDDDFREAGYGDAMTIFDLLTYSDGSAAPSGRYVNLVSLSGITGAAFTPAPKSFFAKEEARLTGRTEDIKKALERPGWHAGTSGDASAVIDVYKGLTAELRFWDEDEDFPAQLQFMWDEAVLSFMHYETVWFVSGSIVKRVISSPALL